MDEKVDPDRFMQMAIVEGERGSGFVSPNPLVGCVVVNKVGQIIGRGGHLKFGGPHAEVNALEPFLKSGNTQSLQDATLYVTLEPCAHEGKTPSCAKALAKLPLKKVIFGLVDPNPLVAGEGQKIVRAAGIECEEYQGALKQDLENLAEHFLLNQRLKRPFISLKVATSLDGQMALKSGESKWITGDISRLKAHSLRAAHEAILVGQGTLEQDNPSLDIRHPDFSGRANKVILLLSRSRPLELKGLKLLLAHRQENIYFLKSHPSGWQRQNLLANSGVAVLEPGNELFDPAFRKIGGAPPSDKWLANSILVEGGAAVLSSFINKAQFDRLYIFQAPILLGAMSGKSWTELVKINSLGEKLRLKQDLLTPLGDDFLWTGRPLKVEV